MNTFESIHEFVIPADICEASDRQLRDAGSAGNEQFILWSGVLREERFLVRTMHSPKQTAYRLPDGLCVRVEADELHRLNVWLYENGERLGVQVHSHPTEAFHSDTDDTYPMVTTLGGCRWWYRTSPGTAYGVAAPPCTACRTRDGRRFRQPMPCTSCRWKIERGPRLFST